MGVTNEKPSHNQVEEQFDVSIPNFMLPHEHRIRKEEKEEKHLVRDIVVVLGLGLMVYSFLWIDVATIPSLIGTTAGAALFIGGANYEVDL